MRKIYIIVAWIVDANGTFHTLDGYPKTFDSRGYSDDIEKTLRRAKSDFFETISNMCKVDTRKVQSVILMDELGYVIEIFSTGDINTPAE